MQINTTSSSQNIFVSYEIIYKYSLNPLVVRYYADDTDQHHLRTIYRLETSPTTHHYILIIKYNYGFGEILNWIKTLPNCGFQLKVDPLNLNIYVTADPTPVDVDHAAHACRCI